MTTSRRETPPPSPKHTHSPIEREIEREIIIKKIRVSPPSHSADTIGKLLLPPLRLAGDLPAVRIICGLLETFTCTESTTEEGGASSSSEANSVGCMSCVSCVSSESASEGAGAVEG